LLHVAEGKALVLNLMEIEYGRLARTKNNNEKMYSLVLERSKEAGLTQMLRVNNIQILAPAVTLEEPVSPRMGLIFVVGGLGGLVLGLGAAIAREQLDSTLKSLHDMETLVGLSPLGALPELGLKPAASSVGAAGRRRRRASQDDPPELIVHREPTSGFAEAMRTVRTNVLFMSPDQPFKRLLITSANPAEGKTTIACSLSITMAQTGKRVLLVDCDLRRPRLHTVFSLTAPGLSTLSQTLLAPDSLRLGDLNSSVPGLDVLTAGPLPPNPSELLHSERFNRILERLSAAYDLVILDSPPLLISDAAIMSTVVDGVLLVARAGRTDTSSAIRSYRAIRDVGGRVVGGILNGVNPAKHGYGYGYGYGYGKYGDTPYGQDTSKKG
jgi:capsular exopolysaccharide synthesis family protein